MKISELCTPDPGIGIAKDAGEKRIHVFWGGFNLPYPEGVKRIRFKCPKCGRKLLSSVKYCHDGCCIIHTIPPHKPKGWWKQKKRLDQILK